MTRLVFLFLGIVIALALAGFKMIASSLAPLGKEMVSTGPKRDYATIDRRRTVHNG